MGSEKYFIEFSKIGLRFDISPIALSLGSIRIRWYALMLTLGMLTAVLLALKTCKKYGFKSDDILDLFLFGAPVAIICARLYFVLFKFDQYISNPFEIFAIWKGGIAIYGAVIGALLTGLVLARKRGLSFLALADFCVPYFILAQAIGRWGNFFNQEAFGGLAGNLPWGMTGNIIGNKPVHPTFLYESLWDVAVFITLIILRKRKKVNGEIFYLFMALYGFGRMWIEGMRTDSLYFFNMRISQVLAGIFVIVFGGIYICQKKGIGSKLAYKLANSNNRFLKWVFASKENPTKDEEKR
jgi:phosphatidylglycerol---prolipoprotein diacylglyceryl transferase